MPWKDKSKYKSEAYREYMRSYQRDWHQRHKAERVAKVRERKVKLKEFYKQLKENLECSQCGENHPAALHFHHLDPQQKDFNLATAMEHAYGIQRIKREIGKCIVLCANCHAKYHYDRSIDRLPKSELSMEMRADDQVKNFTEPLSDRYFPEGIDLTDEFYMNLERLRRIKSNSELVYRKLQTKKGSR